MRPRRVIPLFVISAMLLGFIVYWSDPTEPSYQGRKLSAWLDDLVPAMDQRQLDKWEEAKKAIRSAGVKAAPYIVRRLKVDDSTWRRKYRSSCPNFPSRLQKILPAPKAEFTDLHGSDAF